jgi:hypothetical protein
VRIEVFFDPAKLGQEIDFKSSLRGQNFLFRQTDGTAFAVPFFMQAKQNAAVFQRRL